MRHHTIARRANTAQRDSKSTSIEKCPEGLRLAGGLVCIELRVDGLGFKVVVGGEVG